MKEKIVVLQRDDKIYLRQVDVKRLKSVLNLANIEVQETSHGKYTGVPRYYIPITQGFKFIQSIISDYTVTFL